ncbi:hypothetical protein J0H58_03880 [bacterium]|nr:hypothetical protein [bacterium]
MTDPTKRPGDIPQREDDTAPSEPTRMGRDDPSPSPQQQAEATPKPAPRRDNQAEAITGAPTV